MTSKRRREITAAIIQAGAEVLRFESARGRGYPFFIIRLPNGEERELRVSNTPSDRNSVNQIRRQVARMVRAALAPTRLPLLWVKYLVGEGYVLVESVDRPDNSVLFSAAR